MGGIWTCTLGMKSLAGILLTISPTLDVSRYRGTTGEIQVARDHDLTAFFTFIPCLFNLKIRCKNENYDLPYFSTIRDFRVIRTIDTLTVFSPLAPPSLLLTNGSRRSSRCEVAGTPP